MVTVTEVEFRVPKPYFADVMDKGLLFLKVMTTLMPSVHADRLPDDSYRVVFRATYLDKVPTGLTSFREEVVGYRAASVK